MEAGARDIVVRFIGPDPMRQLERATGGVLPSLRGG
jgi:hypothetical protein